MARSRESARRIRARQQRRERSSLQIDRRWQKWINCELCGKPYCCNNYPDRKPRSYKLYGYRCCPLCFFRVGPVVNKLIKDKVLKVRKRHAEV